MCFKSLEKIKKLKTSSLMAWAFGKFLVGLGLGALLAANLQKIDWNTWSVISIAIGILIVIKAVYLKK